MSVMPKKTDKQDKQDTQDVFDTFTPDEEGMPGESDAIREVNRIIRLYPDISHELNTIKRRRPSLMRIFSEMDSQQFRDKLRDGHTGLGIRDVDTLKAYLWDAWAVDVIKATLEERCTKRDAAVFKAVCLERKSIPEAAQRFGISVHTAQRIRIKVKHHMADEILFRWSMRRSYLDYPDTSSNTTTGANGAACTDGVNQAPSETMSSEDGL